MKNKLEEDLGKFEEDIESLKINQMKILKLRTTTSKININ